MIFDPVFIIYQIVSLQCSFYLAMGTMWGICHAVFDKPISLEHFFTPKYIDFVSFSGWIEAICTFATAIVGYFLVILNFKNG